MMPSPAALPPTLALLIAVVAATGCSLKQAAPIKKSFLIEAQRTGAARTGAPTMVLRLRNVSVAPPFAGRSFVYRRGEFEYEAEFYHEFLVPPRALFIEQTSHWLSRSGIFALVDVTGRSDPPYVLDGTVSALYGDMRDKQAPKAVLAIDFVLTDEQSRSIPGLWTHRYKEELPLDRATPEALAAGWSTALQRVLTALEQDLEKDLAAASRPRASQ